MCVPQLDCTGVLTILYSVLQNKRLYLVLVLCLLSQVQYWSTVVLNISRAAPFLFTVKVVKSNEIFRAVPTDAESAAKFSRNRAFRTPFLRLIFDHDWKGSKVVSAELVLNVQLVSFKFGQGNRIPKFLTPYSLLEYQPRYQVLYSVSFSLVYLERWFAKM